MTKEQWNEFKKLLIPGCTFIFSYPNESGELGTINPDKFTACFIHATWDKNWPILGIGGDRHYSKLSNFCWPDGSPMPIPDEPSPPTKQELVIAKCNSLDSRFKAKSLPKTKAICNLPDKQQIINNNSKNLNLEKVYNIVFF